MLWLYLLAAVTVLVIALRRVVRRQKPLGDELYSKTVAVEHVQSGIAWIQLDGTIGSANHAFAAIFSQEKNPDPKTLIGRDWHTLVEERDRDLLQEAYRQMLIQGKYTIEVNGKMIEETAPGLELILVAVHDHKMRFVGHHCLVADRTREKLLEAQVRQMRYSLALRNPSSSVETAAPKVELCSQGLQALGQELTRSEERRKTDRRNSERRTNDRRAANPPIALTYSNPVGRKSENPAPAKASNQKILQLNLGSSVESNDVSDETAANHTAAEFTNAHIQDSTRGSGASSEINNEITLPGDQATAGGNTEDSANPQRRRDTAEAQPA